MAFKFIKKSLVFLLLLVCSIILIGALPREAVVNVFVDKEESLRTTPSPRIVFIGGSGLIFGLDSTCVESAFGLPVVNAGLHAGLGLQFILRHARTYVRPGDIIIIIPEYGVLARGYAFNAPATASLVFSDIRDKVNYLSPIDYFNGLQGFPSVAYEKLLVRPITRLRASQRPFAYPHPFYWRRSFNAYGDYTAHLTTSKTLSPEELKTYAPITSNIDDAVVMMNEFAEYVDQHGARALFVFSPTVDTRYQKYVSVVTAIYDHLKQDLKMQIVAPPSNYIFPIDYFYDTPEHLTARGRKARTERLIADLKQIQPGITNVSTISNTCVDGSKP
jgi:hypothetical protein